MEIIARLANLPGALPGACAQGLIWGIMAIGVYLTYRILDVADLTVDGSFGTGGAVCVMCLLSGGQRQALTLLMATMNKPKLLLLDEHTAALDPKTALKVLTLSARIVEENHLTTMMITHNMKDAIKYGNRLIMMHEGHIIYDVAGEEKQKLHVSDLLAKFQIASGGEFANDRMILSN